MEYRRTAALSMVAFLLSEVGIYGATSASDPHAECVRLARPIQGAEAASGDAGTDAEAAIAACERALTEDPASKEVLFLSGMALQAGRRHTDGLERYRAAAEEGHAGAMNALGDAHRMGEGVAQSYEDAVLWYRRAARKQNPDAEYNLGLLYDKGLGVRQSNKRATVHYRKAAAQGHVAAQYALALLYESEGQRRWAAEQYEAAAEQGHAQAQFRLGQLHEQGIGVVRDQLLAEEWYQKAASQGHAGAMASLVGLGEELAPLQPYLDSAKNGDAEAQFQIGLMYERGEEVSRDTSRAAGWFYKAAKQDHVEAQFRLALLYDGGTGSVMRDPGFAAEWYHRAADQGHPGAMTNLGRLYILGDGVPTDPRQAEMFLKRALAARPDNDVAVLNMGILYASFGIAPQATAVEWLSRARDSEDRDVSQMARQAINMLASKESMKSSPTGGAVTDNRDYTCRNAFCGTPEYNAMMLQYATGGM